MKQLVFTIQIKATKEKVWKILWDDRTYRMWTSVFSEGSHVKTNWQEGGKILFLNGQGNGMYSIIEKNRPYEFMFFRHLGEVKGGKEMPQTEEQMLGSTENYTLKESGGFTDLTVSVETEAEYQNYFTQQFPKALEKLKGLAEGY